MNAKIDAEIGTHLPEGFSFSSITAGIKVSGRPDLALVECTPGTTAAAMFTRNRVVAAPLLVDREALTRSHGAVRAVIVNSGNANCATGKQGIRDAQEVCAEVARLLRIRADQVFPSSTGIIGVPLPTRKIISSLPFLVNSRENSEDAALQFAKTIMTTDTRPKIASTDFVCRGGRVRLMGIAKGSGMIHPNLATMLVYLFTDLAASPAQLKRALREASNQSFNCISVDGDTSTNDTVLLLASGKSGVSLNACSISIFREQLLNICYSLAEQIVSDGEGVRHVIRLIIEGAKNRAEAMQVARTIAHSPLVKTAWAGADPNWGRILAAVGRAEVPVRPENISISIGDQEVFRRGAVVAFDEKAAHRRLSQATCDVIVRLGRGKAHLTFLTTDLTSEYVRINAEYST